jgi:hypothetical protein
MRDKIVENVNAGMTRALDRFVKGQDGNFALLYSVFDELMGEGTTVSTSDYKPQVGGVPC